MFDDITYESLLAKKLAKVKKNIDKTEGSIIYDTLALNSYETYELYLELKRYYDESFADTASRPYLIRHGRDVGVIPYPATNAKLRGEFNVEIPLGTRFSCSNLVYATKERIDEEGFVYCMECETAGSVGNSVLGQLRPIDAYITGLTSAELVDLIVPGKDEEDTESLRERYYEQFNGLAFGGNIADYKQKVKSLDGVGCVKVYRAWAGGGTVKLAILCRAQGIVPEYFSPSPDLVARLQEQVDPIGYQGEGLGLAPIGHVVTVVAAATTSINISFSITYATGYTWTDVEQSVKKIIDQYFDEMNSTWEDAEVLVVRILQIESRLLALPQIIDVTGTTLNGLADNLALEKDHIAVRGEISEK